MKRAKLKTCQELANAKPRKMRKLVEAESDEAEALAKELAKAKFVKRGSWLRPKLMKRKPSPSAPLLFQTYERAKQTISINNPDYDLLTYVDCQGVNEYNTCITNCLWRYVGSNCFRFFTKSKFNDLLRRLQASRACERGVQGLHRTRARV